MPSPQDSTQIRHAMVGQMAEVSSGLVALRDLMAKVIDQLAEIISLLPASGERGPDVGDILARLSRAISGWGATIAARPDTGANRALKDGLAELSNISRVFRFVSSVTAMQVAQMRTAMLERFVEDLRDVATRIEAEVGDANRAVTRLSGLRGVIEGSVAEAATTFRTQADRAAAIIAPVTGLATALREDTVVVAGTADQSRQIVQAEITGIVFAMQFSDSASQRLEHVEEILELESGGGAMSQLASAHLTALSGDSAAMMTGLEGNFATLDAAARKVMQVFGSQGDLAARLFASQSLAFGTLDQVRADLDPVVANVSGAVGRAQDDVDGMHERLGKLSEIGMAIHLAAMNARLNAGRDNNGRDVLSHISGIVKESAEVGRVQIDRCLDALLQIRITYGSDALTEVQGNLEEFAQSVRRNQANLAAAQRREAALAALRDDLISTAADLTMVIAHARRSTQGLDDVIQAMSNLSDHLKRAHPEPPDLAPLAAVKSIYTMDREREIHAEFCGEEAFPEPAATLDLDDILF